MEHKSVPKYLIVEQQAATDFEMVHDMYDVIVQELVEPGRARRFLGERTACRYCGASDPKVFGKQTNAHAFPAALGNRTL